MYATASAPKKTLFSCSFVLASTAFAVGKDPGVEKVIVSAACSVPKAPLSIISIISSNAAFDLDSAVASAATLAKAAVAAFAT